MGVDRIEFILRQRAISQPQLYWNVVKPARREAAIEMPQSRNDHPDHRDLDVRACLIEHEEIVALLLGDMHAGVHLLAHVETAELRTRARLNHRFVAWRQKRVVLQAKWSRTIKARFLSGPAPHQTDGQELV